MPRYHLQQAVLLIYLAVTAGALIFTFTKVAFPFPEAVTHWSYGMIAPYQGDTSWNADFIYEGQLPNGSWEVINIDPYMPYIFGEKNARKFLRVYQRYGNLEHRRKFGEFALLVLDHEREQGKSYQAIRVWFDQWDRSPAGYEYLHTPEFTKRELVTTVR